LYKNNKDLLIIIKQTLSSLVDYEITYRERRRLNILRISIKIKQIFRGLAHDAAKVDADIILFNGVHFSADQ